MIGHVLAVPIIETVIGFLLLAPGIGGKGESTLSRLSGVNTVGAASELWMISGLATGMSLDMGLHMASPS